MAKHKKSWREKLADDKGLPKVVTLPAAARKRWGGASMAIPAPREVDALMRRVPSGKLVTINELRDLIAKKHKAEVGCPITTGIFAWMAAHAAEEAAAEGASDVTPYWRTLKKGGELNPKYPGGVSRLRQKLEAEGHRVVPKGKRWVVAEFEKSLLKALPRGTAKH